MTDIMIRWLFCYRRADMKNKEFWKGAAAGALVVTCIGTGIFMGTGLAKNDSVLGDRQCTSKLVYLEDMIDKF